jgi:protein-S-isoprenylcysteine O-methyltransferase Ste14
MSARRNLEKWCFEHRVELASLIGGIGFLFFLFSTDHLSRALAQRFAWPEETSVRGIYIFLALVNTLSGALRIWAGGTLGGARMMAVHVQTDAIITAGPYGRLRNPIYLADIMTLGGMALVVPWPGSVLVLFLLATIYPLVMSHEERSLAAALGQPYVNYKDSVRRLIPRLTRYNGGVGGGAFDLREGLVNNFIYLPLIPGFAVSAVTGTLWHGVAVGAIGPLGWVALHFWRNFKPGGLAEKAKEDG